MKKRYFALLALVLLASIAYYFSCRQPAWQGQLRKGMTTAEFRKHLGSGQESSGVKAVGTRLVREPGFTTSWHRNGFVIWARFDDAGIATELEIEEETESLTWSEWFDQRRNDFFHLFR